MSRSELRVDVQPVERGAHSVYTVALCANGRTLYAVNYIYYIVLFLGKFCRIYNYRKQ